jgi:arsenate reductase (glutaredoxin)
VEVWNNDECSKCAAARGTLEEADIAYTVRDYLANPPTAAEFDDVLKRLGAEPWDVARLNEPVADDLALADAPRDRARWIEVMVANPVLIQRPILLLDDGSALIGRSVEALRRAIAVPGASH